MPFRGKGAARKSLVVGITLGLSLSAATVTPAAAVWSNLYNSSPNSPIVDNAYAGAWAR